MLHKDILKIIDFPSEFCSGCMNENGRCRSRCVDDLQKLVWKQRILLWCMTYRSKRDFPRSNESICRILFSSSGCSQSISMAPRDGRGNELSKLVWIWKSVTSCFGVAIAAVEISPTKDRHISRPSGRFVDSNCLQHNRRSSPSTMVTKGSLSL